MRPHQPNIFAYLISGPTRMRQNVDMLHPIVYSTIFLWFACIFPEIPLHLKYMHVHVYVHDYEYSL